MLQQSRADALFEVAEAVLCRQERVHMLAELSLEPEHRRGHGGLYDAVNAGRADVTRLRRSLAGLCRCRPGPMAGSGWPPMSVTGCGRTRPPARIGCSATVTRGGRGTRR